MLVSAVQQSESVLHVYIYLYSFLDFLSILNELLTSYCFNLKWFIAKQSSWSWERCINNISLCECATEYLSVHSVKITGWFAVLRIQEVNI